MATEAIIENPFCDYGNIVTGRRFIGRKNEQEKIRKRVLAKNGGNLSIVGIPRIGKSSLVWNTLVIDQNKLLGEKKILIEINVGSIDNSKDLFKAMAFEVLEILKEILDESLLQRLNKTCLEFSDDISDYEIRNTLFKYLRRLKKTNYHVIYIFEEFDKGGEFLSLSDFQALREIGTRPEYGVKYVTISRRTIQELEAKNGALSRFYAIFDYLNLSTFSKEDTKVYWEVLKDYDIKVPENYKSRAHSLVGSHPFLLAIVNYEVFNDFLYSDGSADLYTILNEKFLENNLNLLYHFDEIVALMKDEGLVSKLFQALVGPVFDLDVKSVEKLIKFGLVKKLIDENGKEIGFEGFSKCFTEYLRIQRNEFPIWELWSSTEIELRNLIKYYLTEKYGENWEDNFIRMNRSKASAIEDLKKTLAKNKSTFGNRASDSLVDYTYPADMYNIFMQADWPWFNSILKDNNKLWREKFNHFAMVRNPIAHNNKPFITNEQKNLAIEYCNLVLGRIKEWNESKHR